MSLPGFLKTVFWDVRFEELDARRDRDAIVARIAEYGTDETVRWMQENYTPGEIAESLERECHRVSARTLNLWRLWLRKPEDWCRKTPSRPLKGVFWKS